MEGGVLEETPVTTEISDDELRRQLTSMTGVLRLPVSAYSAIKKDGVPMYKRARAAEKVGERVEEVPVRDMEVLESEFLASTYDSEKKRQVAQARFVVSSGTYVRSLAEEFGTRLGYPATLGNLRRTKVGNFVVEDAQKLDGV